MKSKTPLKPKPFTRLALTIAAALLCGALSSRATILFSDNFDTNSSSLWTVNVAPAANASLQDATFAFDYSAFGIPPAPGSTNTFGLRLRSNIPGGSASPVTTRPAGVLSGLSVSPTGQDFGTNFHVSFYAWVNFNGAANATGLGDNGNSEGGTHNILFAVGTSGTVPLVVGNTGLASGASMDGIGFATTGDGGITSDYRVYPKSGTISTAASGVYAAGTANDTNAVSPLGNVNLYYQKIPSLAPHAAPGIQTNISAAEYSGDASNTQLGSTQLGAFGFAWQHVALYRSGNIVKWTIDNTAIATIDITALAPLGGNNIALGDSDVNTSTTRHPSLLFSLIDNLVVSDITQPTLTAARSGTNVNFSWPETNGSGFSFQYAPSLTYPTVIWTNATNTITNISGTLSTTIPTVATQGFYRLKLP